MVTACLSSASTAASALFAVLLDALKQQCKKALQASTDRGMLYFCSGYASIESAPAVQVIRPHGR